MKRFAALFALLTVLLALALAPSRLAAQDESKQSARYEEEERKEAAMRPWQWINFLILLTAIVYLARKTSGPFFKARTEEIRRGMVDAERMRAESETRTREVDAKLANLGKEIESIRAAVREEQAHEDERLRQRMEADLARIQTHAEQEIESAGKAARLELRRYAAHLAVAIAEEKLRARMSPELDESLTHAFVRDLPHPAPGAQAR